MIETISMLGLDHEYLMALYGVSAWQLWELIHSKNKITVKDHIKIIVQSMFFAGLVVIFDDELLSHYNKIADLDYQTVPKLGYSLAGFSIDILVSKFIKKDGKV